VHLGDLNQAERHARFAAQSPYPIHAALGSLALAAVQTLRGQTPAALDTARTLGRHINARLIEAETNRLEAARKSGHEFEVFFP
jgi:hypothetical protein